MGQTIEPNRLLFIVIEANERTRKREEELFVIHVGLMMRELVFWYNAVCYPFQNVIAPLVKLEADYDRKMKEAQTQEGVRVSWDIGLNGKNMATFRFGSANVGAKQLYENWRNERLK